MKTELEKEFAPYTEAFQMKKLEFDELCFATWCGDTLDVSLQVPSDDYFTQAPTYSQCFRWFREKKNFHGCIDLHVSMPQRYFFRIDDILTNDYLYHSCDDELMFENYPDAELACLKTLIDIAQKQKEVK